MLNVILGIASIVGVLGYYNDIGWLFYIAGGFCFLIDAISFISGQLRPIAKVVTIVAWIVGNLYSGSFLDGVIWGSCFSTLLALCLYLPVLLMALMSVLGMMIGGVMIVFNKVKSLFCKDNK